MSRTKQDMLAEANKLEKSLKKLNGKKRKATAMKMHNLRWRAKQKSNGTKKTSKPKKAKKSTFNPAQGFLDGFLEQMPTARIEEQVTDLVFQALRRGIAKRLSEKLGFELKLVETA